MVMSLSGPCVVEGSPAGEEVLTEDGPGFWGLTDCKHLSKTAHVQMFLWCASKIDHSACDAKNTLYILYLQCSLDWLVRCGRYSRSL